MKKKLFLLIVSIFSLFLTACEKNTALEEENEEFYECQKGFMGNSGNKICETPDGYYFIMGNYLMFADHNLKQKTLVCAKAECLHNNESKENKVKCDAFFDGIRALNYYNGKLYVLANNWSEKQNHVSSIYEVEPDGSGRRVIYSGVEETQAFCIHKGEAYVYEKKYVDESGNVSTMPILTITRFLIQKPKKTEIIFQNNDYKNGEINGLRCYKNYCYFRIVDFMPDNLFSVEQKINLKTKEITDSAEKSEYIEIGKDRIFSKETVESDSTNWTWKEEYCQWSLDEKTKKQLTADDFQAIGKNAILIGVDDRYVYFKDVDYGANAVPEEKQKLYVYTYDGDCVCEILGGDMSHILDFYAGNEQYLFFYEQKEGEEGTEIIFRYIDKEKFGEDAEPKVLFSGNYENFAGEVVY